MDATRTTVDEWQRLVAGIFEGRDVVLAGGVLAGYTQRIDRLRVAGVKRFLCISNSTGTGPLPEGDDVTVCMSEFSAPTVMGEFRAWERLLADPPSEVLDALEAFDPRGEAIVLIVPFVAADRLGERPGFGPRRPEWVALDDKTLCDALFDRAGVLRPSSTIVHASPRALTAAAKEVDAGSGTVWAGDASRGFNGGGEYVRWVRDPRDVADAAEFFARHCEHVRVAPFIEGIPSSLHGFVCADGVAVLRPVELVTLRPPTGSRFRYAGAATYWDPPAADREAMRAAVRRVGEMLRDEVDFRGIFTVDGILAAGGWVPTELNPRMGAGIGYAYGAAPDAALDLLHHVVIEGDTTVHADDIEAVVLPGADALRWGGGWTTVDREFEATDVVALAPGESGGFRRASDAADDVVARIIRGPSAVGGFVRCMFEPDRTPVGPSIAPRVIDAFAFADREFGTDIGPLRPAAALR
jgi:hypothetical protein